MKNLWIPTVLLTLSSFTFRGHHPIATGRYGVCLCDSAQKPAGASIEITFSDDHTFHYMNDSDPANRVDVKGKWNYRNNNIKLYDYGTSEMVPETWVPVANENCIRARKGLYILRLCNDSKCR